MNRLVTDRNARDITRSVSERKAGIMKKHSLVNKPKRDLKTWLNGLSAAWRARWPLFTLWSSHAKLLNLRKVNDYENFILWTRQTNTDTLGLHALLTVLIVLSAKGFILTMSHISCMKTFMLWHSNLINQKNKGPKWLKKKKTCAVIFSFHSQRGEERTRARAACAQEGDYPQPALCRRHRPRRTGQHALPGLLQRQKQTT